MQEYSTIRCRGLCRNYLEKISQTWWSRAGVFYNKVSWFVSELPEKDISNVVAQRKYSSILQ